MSLDDRELDGMLRELPAEVAPERDLWPGVRAGIRRARRKSVLESWLPLAAVASLSLVVALGMLATPSSMETEEEGAPGLLNAPGSLRPVAYGPGDNVGPSFVLARSRLSERADELLEGLDPAARGIVERDLAELRRSQQELNTALQADPDNQHLQRLLLNSYRRELVLLQEVTQLVTDLPRRTDL